MTDADYEVNACAPGALSREELETCAAIIEMGGAVDPDSMVRDLPRAIVIAIARKGDQIVGVGAIKPVRPKYAAKIARNSGITIPAETLELGYVAVKDAHRGHGLSHRISEILITSHAGRLFATTDDKRMKKTLSEAGFVQKGIEWPGHRATLSFWERL
jgi:GNAT superfamily N-acetyltransferase